jgi:hypothetical protein
MQLVNEACYLLSLFALVVCAVVGIYSEGYKDTLLQRVGMGLVAFAGPVAIIQTLVSNRAYAAAGVTLGGCAVYAVGTLIKQARA